MRILWLATDRSNRVANIFGPLQKNVSNIVDVDFIYKKLDLLPRDWQVKNKKKKSKKLLNPKYANEYDFIMVDAPFAFLDENWQKIKTKKCVLIEDQHGDVVNYSKEYVRFGFDIFFTRYNNILDNHKHLKNSKVIWLPHSIDNEIIKDYNRKKEIECLMIGRISSNVYPLRQFIHNQLSNEKWYKRVRRPMETLEKRKKWPVGKDYAKLINSSYISFSCLSKFQYPVLKFFEIPGCNSVLFSDYNRELRDLGFIDGKNMIKLTDSISDFKSFIIKELKDKNRLEDISNEGYKMIHKNHTVKKRSEEFLNYLENIR